MSKCQYTRPKLFKISLLFFFLFAFTNAYLFAGTENGVVSGQMKKWHSVTITFDGPMTSEDAEDNPFLDYRLDVIFENDTNKFTVPGYYAADGNAANTSANSGNKWRVQFVPDKTGQWKYTAYFSKGKDIAIKPFRPEKPFGKGKFHIGPSDIKAPDFRAKGMLRYVGKRYLQFAETNDFFIKAGADTPENFLAYYEFDGTYDTNDNGDILENGFLHKYPNHLKDWHQGDPTFKNGKGKAIIGALNYLAWKGMNSVYFIPYNIDGGDGKDTWPWMNHTHRLRFDCSKLDQWEIVFSHMDKLGLMLHIILQEEENAHQLDEGNLGKQRKLYYREMIARFSHHLAILWNLGEEITNTTEQQMAFAEYIHKIDPYDHPVILHTYPDNHDEIYTPLLGFEFIEGASLQTDQAHKMTKKWVKRSTPKGRAWIVFMDEIANVEIGVAPDSVDYTHDMPRKEYLWPSLLAGGAGVEWYFGYSFPDNDIECEDWRSRDHMWDLTRYAIDFFHKYLPFTEMYSADELTTAANDYCFAKPGQIYAIYLPDSGTTELDLGQSSEKFTVKWYNPREGGNLLDGSIKNISGPGKKHIGLPPSDNNKDWLALIRLSSFNAD